MHNHYAVLQYHGMGFAGWQRQKSDRTVQGELESALHVINNKPVTVFGAGRTDAGVHALGQVASFSLTREWTARELRRALNARTPYDIWIAEAGPAPEDFHARKSASARRYRYVVGCDDSARSPFRQPFEWAVGGPLDFDLLQAGAALFLGEHSFRALSAHNQTKPHYRCTVNEAKWSLREVQHGFIFTIDANRFLHRMVRFLVGIMVDVARDKRSLGDISHLLNKEDNQTASSPAPARGLYFLQARYPQLQLEPIHEIFS